MPKPTELGQLRALANLLEPNRERLYRFVLGETRPVTRDEAAAATGVSRAMAAFHLDRLVEVGLLRPTYRRVSGRTGRGAGRPAKLYARSRRRFAIAFPKRDHQLLARLLAQGPPSAIREAADRFGRLVGARARQRLNGSVRGRARRSRCVSDVLGEIGFEPTQVGLETWCRNCPFDPVSRESPEVVCKTAVAMIGGVVAGVGSDGLDVAERQRAGWCCVVVTAMAEPDGSLS